MNKRSLRKAIKDAAKVGMLGENAAFLEASDRAPPMRERGGKPLAQTEFSYPEDANIRRHFRERPMERKRGPQNLLRDRTIHQQRVQAMLRPSNWHQIRRLERRGKMAPEPKPSVLDTAKGEDLLEVIEERFPGFDRARALASGDASQGMALPAPGDRSRDAELAGQTRAGGGEEAQEAASRFESMLFDEEEFLWKDYKHWFTKDVLEWKGNRGDRSAEEEEAAEARDEDYDVLASKVQKEFDALKSIVDAMGTTLEKDEAQLKEEIDAFNDPKLSREFQSMRRQGKGAREGLFMVLEDLQGAFSRTLDHESDLAPIRKGVRKIQAKVEGHLGRSNRESSALRSKAGTGREKASPNMVDDAGFDFIFDPVLQEIRDAVQAAMDDPRGRGERGERRERGERGEGQGEGEWEDALLEALKGENVTLVEMMAKFPLPLDASDAYAKTRRLEWSGWFARKVCDERGCSLLIDEIDAYLDTFKGKGKEGKGKEGKGKEGKGKEGKGKGKEEGKGVTANTEGMSVRMDEDAKHNVYYWTAMRADALVLKECFAELKQSEADMSLIVQELNPDREGAIDAPPDPRVLALVEKARPELQVFAGSKGLGGGVGKGKGEGKGKGKGKGKGRSDWRAEVDAKVARSLENAMQGGGGGLLSYEEMEAMHKADIAFDKKLMENDPYPEGGSASDEFADDIEFADHDDDEDDEHA